LQELPALKPGVRICLQHIGNKKGRGNCTDLLSLVIICRQYIRGQHASGGAATPLNGYELIMTDFVPLLNYIHRP
jgi:hypothetical protein